ncbi:hypothetical protein BX666DRAFT_1935026 [Dichotomocladium elegans]|nr:hypothetical protein BX666DRAFT_1935026 [Dichotomocladium elegans]
MTSQQPHDRKIAIVTGANSGVGYGIMQRLLDEDDDILIVMACRSFNRADRARQQLLQDHPFADVDIELVDTSNAKSVFQLCNNVKLKYNHIDFLFCNAGIMPTIGINWAEIVLLFFKDPVGLVEKADATIQPRGLVNDDGMGTVFAANVFGHYIMSRELEPLLDASPQGGRIIWTSSLTAEKDCFDLEDWQGIKSALPYESSKWATDLVAVGSNARYKENNQKIISITTSPGVVASAIGSLPGWIIAARRVLHYVYRLCGVSSQNITNYRGAIANVFVAYQPLDALEYYCKYYSLTSRWGRSFVEARNIEEFDQLDAEKLLKHCETAYHAHKRCAAADTQL